MYLHNYNYDQIELMRGYNYESFHEDLKKLYDMAGKQGQDTVFLFTDTQVRCIYMYMYMQSIACTCTYACIITVEPLLMDTPYKGQL